MFDKLWKILVSSAALILIVGVIVYFVTREPQREMTPLMHQLAVDVSSKLGEDLPRRDDVNTMLLLMSGPQARDEQKQFAEMLTDAVYRSAKYDIKTWDEVDKSLDGGVIGWAQKKLGIIPGMAPTTIEHAKEVLAHLDEANVKVDGALLVQIKTFDEGKDRSGLGARITVAAQIYSHNSKKMSEVPDVTREITSSWDRRYLAHTMSQQSIFWRFPLWFLLACGMPWALITVVRQVLSRRSNGWNIGLIVTFTILAVLLAWPLLFKFGIGGGTIVGALFIFLMMGYYNYDAVDYIDRKLR